MKMIHAIIRPERLEAVQAELRGVLDEQDHYRITVQEVEGHGRQEGEIEYVRGRTIRPRLIHKLQISVAINPDYLDPAIEAIQRGARTGEVGDGKIFVLPLERCIRIRTGQEGSEAI